MIITIDTPPCRFCGSTYLAETEWWDDDGEYPAIECRICKAAAPADIWHDPEGALAGILDKQVAEADKLMQEAEARGCESQQGRRLLLELQVLHGRAAVEKARTK